MWNLRNKKEENWLPVAWVGAKWVKRVKRYKLPVIK